MLVSPGVYSHISLQILGVTSIWTSTRIVMSDHGLSHAKVVPSRLQKVWQAPKIRCWRVSSFSIGVNILLFLSVSTDKNLRIANGQAWDLCLKTCLRKYIAMIFFLVLVPGTHSWKLSEHFRYTLSLCIYMCIYMCVCLRIDIHAVFNDAPTWSSKACTEQTAINCTRSWRNFNHSLKV